jgi:hypothetical protein
LLKNKKAMLFKDVMVDQELKNQSFQNELLFKKLKNDQQKKIENDFIIRVGGKINQKRY